MMDSKPLFGFHRVAILLIMLTLLCLWPLPALADDPVVLIPDDTWSSLEDTYSVAWGDWDGDGDLDLAVGNFWEKSNQVYESDYDDNGNLILRLDPANGFGWQSTERYHTASVAWGDWDNDGDLDLAVGNVRVLDQGQLIKGENQVYENDRGTLKLDPTAGWGWRSPEQYDSYSVAWGDMDGDGDLDLAVGNRGQPNQVYENDENTLKFNPNHPNPNQRFGWQAAETFTTSVVAWGDWDEDGELELAVGNDGQPNYVYENEGEILGLAPVWSSGDTENTTSIAWGDWNQDGYLDLAIGNDGQVNQVYENEGGTLSSKSVWESIGEYDTTSITWGDWDGDGDLDLAVGNDEQVNQVYENNGGGLNQTPVWESAGDIRDTRSVAWGDWDGDSDLDLAAGNTGLAANVLYVNDKDNPFLVWSSDEADTSHSVAWGDWDSDGDLDLAVGNHGQANQVYENEGGDLVLAPANSLGWESEELDGTNDVAWGDWNSDGDLDLAVGNSWGYPNRVYDNDKGTLNLVWTSVETDDTKSLAWGDWDNDGDLDLAVGNGSYQANRVYNNIFDLNDESGLVLAWTSTLTDYTSSLAWGDWDNDGDLDLAVGNEFAQPDRVYVNNGHNLDLAWSSNRMEDTLSVTWGDWDSDNDLDLAVGTNEYARVYENQNGTLNFDPSNNSLGWEAQERKDTWDVAWGDWNRDGDLDLATGINWSDANNRIYINDGGDLNSASSWASDEMDHTWDVAWGDVDNDGDLDLAAANAIDRDGQLNRLYQNRGRNRQLLIDNPPYVKLSRPDPTADSYFFSTPHIIKASTIPISFTLFDAEGDNVRFIRAFYSPNGGGYWLPATPAPGTKTTNLPASPWPTGTTNIFLWDAEADLIRNDNVVFRIDAYQGFEGPGPYQRPALSGQSFPFRVEAATWYVKVVDPTGQAIAKAQVYQNGEPILANDDSIALTDQAGLLRLNNPNPGQPLVALRQMKEQTTTRTAHDGWAYRTYLTSLNLDDAGNPYPDTVGEPGEQLVTIRSDDSLTLFNIVISVEWDATYDPEWDWVNWDGNEEPPYLNMIEDALRKASNYLYDVSDGQMAFGQVTIYDNAKFWADADFQISTKNTVRPYAFVGGITSEDEAHTIRVGRFWSGDSGNTGNWNEPAGYRTLIHEFGHYALHLEDEYFIRRFDTNGNFIREDPAACTNQDLIGPPATSGRDRPANASIMYFQYNASELADGDRWNEDCQNTEQHRLNGSSDWATILKHYEGEDWTINTPTSRGNVMAGPNTFPTNLLPFPTITPHNGGNAGGPSRQVRVLNPEGQSVQNALVALQTTNAQGINIAIDQGLTNPSGQIDVYGAKTGDTIRAATFDGSLAKSVSVNDQVNYTIILAPTSVSGSLNQANAATPYLNLIPSNKGDSLTVEVHGVAGDGNLAGRVIPGEGAGSPQPAPLAYSAEADAFTGQVGFAGVGLGSGAVEINGVTGGQIIEINSNYNLQAVEAITRNVLYSEDGNFELHIPSEGIPTDEHSTVLPTGYVPGPLPAGKQVIGSAYEVRLSGALTELEKDGLVRLHYHPEVMGIYTDTAIYYWEASEKKWQLLGGESSEVDNAWAVATNRLGIYALMGVQTAGGIGEDRVYLPLILK
jgi:hypothetical protein